MIAVDTSAEADIMQLISCRQNFSPFFEHMTIGVCDPMRALAEIRFGVDFTGYARPTPIAPNYHALCSGGYVDSGGAAWIGS
jgi:hypothetical protein